MTLREIAVIIAEKEDRSFDIPYLLMIEQRIKIQRSVILRQTLNQNPLDFSYYLSNYILDLEKIKESNDLYGFGCTYLKSKTKLQPSLRVSDVVYFVGSSDFSETFGKVNNQNLKGSLNRKYSGKEVFYDIRDGYLYLFNTSILKVGIRDILENPEKLIAQKENKSESDVEFQCTQDILDRIIQSIWSIDLKIRDKPQEEKMLQSVTNE